MNELIELATLLDGAGYEIVDFHDECYEKERSPNATVYSNRGINLRIIRFKAPKAVEPPSETT